MIWTWCVNSQATVLNNNNNFLKETIIAKKVIRFDISYIYVCLAHLSFKQKYVFFHTCNPCYMLILHYKDNDKY